MTHDIGIILLAFIISTVFGMAWLVMGYNIGFILGKHEKEKENIKNLASQK